MPFNFETMYYGVYPTQKEFFKACDMADVKNIRDRDISRLYKVLERPLKVNRRLRGIVNTRRTALRCFTWAIHAKDASKPGVIEELMPRVFEGIETILKNQLDTELYGRICFPLQLENRPEGNCLKVLPPYKPYEYDFDNGSIYQVDINNSKTPFPQDSRVLYDTTDDAIGGLMRVLMIDEILRYDTTLQYANFLRKLKGLLQIINRGGSKEDEAAAYDAAVNLMKENFVVTGENIDFKLNDVVTNSGAAFKEFLSMMKSEETIAILGQANTTELPSGGGSRAALQVQKLISSDIFYSDMIRVENLVNKYLTLDYNLNQNANASMAELPYLFRLNIEEEEDVEKNAIALREIQALGIDLREDEVYRKIGFTIPKEGDKLINKMIVAPTVPGLPKQ